MSLNPLSADFGINPLSSFADDGVGQVPIEITVGNKQPSPEQLADALLARIGLVGDDLKAYNEAKSEQIGKPFDVWQRFVEMFRAQQSEGQLKYGGLKEVQSGANKGRFTGYVGINSEWRGEVKKFLADRRNIEPSTVETTPTVTAGSGAQSEKVVGLQQSGNEKRAQLNRMLKEKLESVDKDTPAMAGATIAIPRAVPALPTALPIIGGTLLATPAIYTASEFALNALEKGVVTTPAPIPTSDAKPTDVTDRPTVPDIDVGELPKAGPLVPTSTGEVTTTRAPTGTTQPSGPMPPISGPGKEPKGKPPINMDKVGPATIGTAALGKLIADKVNNNSEYNRLADKILKPEARDLLSVEEQQGVVNIATYRELQGLPDYKRVPGNTGTVALLDIDGLKVPGHSTVMERENFGTDNNELRRELLQEIQTKLGKLQGTNYNQFAPPIDNRFLTHAEVEALIKAREQFGTLPEKMTMYIDRDTCRSCRDSLPFVLELYGVKELKIVNSNGDRWMIKPGQETIEITRK